MYSSLMVMLNKQNQRVGYEDPPGDPVKFQIFRQNHCQNTGFRRKSQFSGYQTALPYAIYRWSPFWPQIGPFYGDHLAPIKVSFLLIYWCSTGKIKRWGKIVRRIWDPTSRKGRSHTYEFKIFKLKNPFQLNKKRAPGILQWSILKNEFSKTAMMMRARAKKKKQTQKERS